MGRKAKKNANQLAALAVMIGLASLGAGIYLEYRLRPYRIFHPFTGTQRGWRDQAFEIAMWSVIAAGILMVLARLVRKL